VEVLGMMDVRGWLAAVPLSSEQMILIGGTLLILAAVLLGFRRKTRMVLDSSLVSEELMIYLARIANALEKPSGPSQEQITTEVVRRLEEMASTRPNGKIREIPNSMFAREYQPDK
jgi:hypothetical protein